VPYTFNNGQPLANNVTLSYSYQIVNDDPISGIMVFFRTAELDPGQGSPTSNKNTLKIDGPPVKIDVAPTKTITSDYSVLSWPAITPQDAGFVGYNIWRVPYGWDPGIKLNTTPVTGTSYQIPKPSNQSQMTTDDVYVTSVDNSGNNSGKSPFVEVDFRGLPLESTDGNLPSMVTLYNNYPNPFNPETNINFYLPRKGNAKLSVFDLTGKEVVGIVNKELTEGFHSYSFNGSGLSSGVYFYILKSDGQSLVKSFSLIK